MQARNMEKTQKHIDMMLGKHKRDSEEEAGVIKLGDPQNLMPETTMKSPTISLSSSSDGSTPKIDIMHLSTGSNGPDYNEASIVPTIDREMYTKQYKQLNDEKSQLNLKNSILQRKLAEYYKKRKLDHALKDIDNIGGIDLEEKYFTKLLAYEELKGKEQEEMLDIKYKIREGELIRDAGVQEAEKVFQQLQALERNTGTGLIYSKKGKPISDKTVERLLRLQTQKIKMTARLRLRWLRARNAAGKLADQLASLEQLAPGLHVTDYEQLRIDNQNYAEKIEERDDELQRNRVKCTEHNQMLAHVREKMAHTDGTIDQAECDLGDTEYEYLQAREDLNNEKVRRDNLRTTLAKEYRESGLLLRKDLLRDFERSITELEELHQKRDEMEGAIAQMHEDLKHKRATLQGKRMSSQEPPPFKIRSASAPNTPRGEVNVVNARLRCRC